jgi:LPXTG-site transpeptidase (sortase) family protein
MYRRYLPSYRRANPAATLIRMVILGGLLGVAFTAADRAQDQPAAAPPPTLRSILTLAPTLPPPTAPPAAQTAPTPVPLASLLIPSAGVNANVVAVYLGSVSWDVSALGGNVGHLEGTAWFGSPGNIGLAGHAEMSDGRPGVFAGLDRLAPGDPIILMQGGREQRYRVREVRRVEPRDLTVLYPSTTERMTLITCDDYSFVQNTYLERIAVIADRVA